MRWTKKASRNLDDVAEHIALDNPSASVRTVLKIIAAVEHLSEHPAIGRAGRVEGTRELVVPGLPYIVPYRVKGNTVEILRVLHGARKWPVRYKPIDDPR